MGANELADVIDARIAEATRHFGLIPNLFRPETGVAGFAGELWSFAKSAYLDGGLRLDIAEDEIEVCVGSLRPDETAVLMFLKSLNGGHAGSGSSKVINGPWPGLDAVTH